MSNDISGAQRAIRRQKAATQVQAKQVLDQQSNIGVDADERQAVVEGQQMSQAVRNAQHEALAATWTEQYQHVIRLWTDHLHTIWPRLATVTMFDEAEHMPSRWRWSNIIDSYGNAIQSSDMLDFDSVHDANEHREHWATMYGTVADWCWERLTRMTDYDQTEPPTEIGVRISEPGVTGSALVVISKQWAGFNCEVWATMDKDFPRDWDIKRIDIGDPQDDNEVHFDDIERLTRLRRYIPLNQAESKAYSGATQANRDKRDATQSSQVKARIYNKAGVYLGLPGHRTTDPIEEPVAEPIGETMPTDEDIDSGDRRASEDDGHWPANDFEPDPELVAQQEEDAKVARLEAEDREFLERLRRLVALPPLPE